MLNDLNKSEFTKNPFVIFAPFLFLYIFLVILFPTSGSSGDEGRYLIYAHYIYNGYLPPTEVSIDILGNGPGYSIILIPFVILHIPIIGITLLNALLYYFSIVLLFKTAKRLVSFRKSLLLCLFWACYFNSYEIITLILPETFIAFLVCLLIFFTIRAFDNKNLKKQRIYVFLSGLTIGYIAITKPIFGYVLLIILICSGVLWIKRRKSVSYKRITIISLIALASTIPYLAYTYNSTGKLYYWSTFGGNNLYWMSSPVDGEYGSWLPDPKISKDYVESAHTNLSAFEGNINKKQKWDSAFYNYIIYLNHQKDFQKINSLKGVQKDDEYKKIAIDNIKSYPFKFLKNCISNIGRIFFNFPFSYKFETPGTLLRLPLSGTIVLLTIFCLFPTLKNWNKVIVPIKFMLFIALLYFGGSVLASAETRMLTTIIPILLLWIAFTIDKSVRLNLKWQ